MSDGEVSRSWAWMGLFALVFLILGAMDLLQGEPLFGSGLLVCGMGSGLFAVGDRMDGVSGRGRPWRIVAGAVSLLGIGLLSLAVFGGG